MEGRLGSQLYREAHDAALQTNQQSTFTWSKYKEDLTTTEKLLQELPLTLSKQVLVPIGNKAFMPGRIVHTNEYLVCVGSGYFVKSTASQAQQFCQRRIQSCDETLGKLEAELSLLTNKLELPYREEIFGAEDRPEIVEHVTEEEYDKIQKEHRQKEKEYRQKLAELRSKPSPQIESEEDLWSRLDQLELEEELEDELQRLHENQGSDDEDDDDDDEEEKEEVNKSEEIRESNSTADTMPLATKTRKQSVVFMDESSERKDDDPPPLRLSFKHSDSPAASAAGTPGSNITSPSEIFSKYLSDRQASSPVSIMKVKENPNAKKEKMALSAMENISDEDEPKQPTFVPSGYVIPDVVQSSGDVLPAPSSTGSQSQRPVSKFKASRLNKR